MVWSPQTRQLWWGARLGGQGGARGPAQGHAPWIPPSLPHQSWPDHVCRLPNMCGFPTMYQVSRYTGSGILEPFVHTHIGLATHSCLLNTSHHHWSYTRTRAKSDPRHLEYINKSEMLSYRVKRCNFRHGRSSSQISCCHSRRYRDAPSELESSSKQLNMPDLDLLVVVEVAGHAWVLEATQHINTSQFGCENGKMSRHDPISTNWIICHTNPVACKYIIVAGTCPNPFLFGDAMPQVWPCDFSASACPVTSRTLMAPVEIMGLTWVWLSQIDPWKGICMG